ncbi:MAG: methylmalonyl Co-A mutase-associated GTPase MeaB [Fibrobacteria bacterium]|nr:methylmalonyl Co-A mutase-associated GTPase MeaB [Fibrobacteria bacterium]
MSAEPLRPDWVPPGAGGEFTTSIQRGVTLGTGVGVSSAPVVRRSEPTPEELLAGILARDRAVLARAITLVESNAPKHRSRADELVRLTLPHSGNAIRIGISGPPGVGKSTFIDAWGSRLVQKGHRVAVLAIDPSSSLNRGSILGDKTRMEELSRLEDAFIRPSPSSGALGGVARKTRETMYLCEAAGFDVILVETVGVGQSETAVRSMTDLFLLLQLAGSGDDLQGIKKGIMEIADLIAVTKADGENRQRAGLARATLAGAVMGLQPYTQGWKPPVLTCSSVTGDGLDTIWSEVLAFQAATRIGGVFEERRKIQIQEWVWSMAAEVLVDKFRRDPGVLASWETVKTSLERGDSTVPLALETILKAFRA